MKNGIDIMVNVTNSDFIRHQNRLNRKFHLTNLLCIGCLALTTYKIYKLRQEMIELKKSNEEEM